MHGPWCVNVRAVDGGGGVDVGVDVVDVVDADVRVDG